MRDCQSVNASRAIHAGMSSCRTLLKGGGGTGMGAFACASDYVDELRMKRRLGQLVNEETCRRSRCSSHIDGRSAGVAI